MTHRVCNFSANLGKIFTSNAIEILFLCGNASFYGRVLLSVSIFEEVFIQIPLIRLISDSTPPCQDLFITFWLIPVVAIGQKVSRVWMTPWRRGTTLWCTLDALSGGLSSLLLSANSPCGNPYGCSIGKETPGKDLFFQCLKAKLATWEQAEFNHRMKYPWKVTDLISVTCATYVHVWLPAWKNFQPFAIR